MASTADLLTDGASRIRQHVDAVLDGATDADLRHRPQGAGNSVAWLVWHLSRVVDDHLADAAGDEQRWTADGWSARFGLALPATDTGFDHDSADVDRVHAPADLLRGYAGAALDAWDGYVRGLSEADLDRVVDENWDPPVTLAARLVSVLDDAAQHAGQAAYVRGLLDATDDQPTAAPNSEPRA